MFLEGELGDALYIVVKGEVSFQTQAGSKTKELGRATSGAYFGERSLLKAEGTRAATVIAVTNTRYCCVVGGSAAFF